VDIELDGVHGILALLTSREQPPKGEAMNDSANLNDEPPLVTRVDVPLALIEKPKRPRPGLLEAILWCVVFLSTQILGAIAGMCVVLTVFAVQSNNPGQFLTDQLAGLGNATAKNAPPEGRPPIPAEIGQSLAYGMLAAQFASLGLILLVVPRIIGKDWKRQIGVRRPAAMHVFLVLLLVPGFMILSGGLQELLAYITGIQQPAANKALNSTFRQVPWYVTFLAVALGPGFVEEVWCRGFLGRGLSARYGLVWGVAVTSILFGLLHVDPSYAAVTAVMGAYLHFVYLASRSIWVPIALHVVNNGLAILISLTQQGPTELDADAKSIASIYYLASFSLVLFGSIALWTSRAGIQTVRNRDGDWRDSPNWKPEYPGISAPPAEAAAEIQMRFARISPVAVLFAFVSFAALLYLLAR
jgi:membrane protease YdiL (CAAX protease family)